jgi:hypothetical protein
MHSKARRQDLDAAALTTWLPVAIGITWLRWVGYGPESLACTWYGRSTRY